MFTAQIQAFPKERVWTLTRMALLPSVQSLLCLLCVALMESAPGGISSPFLFFWWVIAQSHGMPWLSWGLHKVICKDCPSSNSWPTVAINLKRPCSHPLFLSTADCMMPSSHQLSGYPVVFNMRNACADLILKYKYRPRFQVVHQVPIVYLSVLWGKTLLGLQVGDLAGI